MRYLVVVVVLLLVCGACYAQGLGELVPDEAGAAVMLMARTGDAQVRATASWGLFTVKQSSWFLDVWGLDPVGAGMSVRLNRPSALGAGYDAEKKSLCVYLRTAFAF